INPLRFADLRQFGHLLEVALGGLVDVAGCGVEDEDLTGRPVGHGEPARRGAEAGEARAPAADDAAAGTGAVRCLAAAEQIRQGDQPQHADDRPENARLHDPSSRAVNHLNIPMPMSTPRAMCPSRTNVPRTMPAMACPVPPALGCSFRYFSPRMPRTRAAGLRPRPKQGMSANTPRQ